MANAFLGLGSNLGDREASLGRALKEIERLPGTRILRVSRWYETEPVGGPLQGMYLNGVIQIETLLEPKVLLNHLKQIEQKLGRPRKHIPWGPRAIDLDLLGYEDRIQKDPELTLPHPRMHQRGFVLVPLAEICPSWRHPTLGKTAQELLEKLADADRPKA